jgi:acyl-CoA thioesterase
MTPDAKQEQQLAESVVRLMMARDEFSRSLGMSIVEIAPRRSTCRLTVRPDMMNGFGVCHGAVTYALADSALAFACNTHGRVTMAIENSIGYPAAVSIGDVLTAVAVEDSATNRLGFYTVRVTNQNGTVVAVFRGTVFRTKIEHLITNTPKDSAAQ